MRVTLSDQNIFHMRGGGLAVPALTKAVKKESGACQSPVAAYRWAARYKSFVFGRETAGYYKCTGILLANGVRCDFEE
jgi:hypothetical protein